MSAAQQLASAGATAGQSLPDAKDEDDDDDIPELEAAEDEGPVDETGVDPKDIDLVIQQVGCSRGKAVKALKEAGGDLINASESPLPFTRFVASYSSSQSWPQASSQFNHLYIFLSNRIIPALLVNHVLHR
jgi:HYPK UBA domain